jgi:TolA-binding protein
MTPPPARSGGGDSLTTTEDFFNEVQSLGQVDLFCFHVLIQFCIDQIEGVKELVRKINDHIGKIEELHSLSLVNINESQAEENSHQLDRMIQRTAKMNNQAKDRIKGWFGGSIFMNSNWFGKIRLLRDSSLLAIELSNARMPPASGELPMRKTQVGGLLSLHFQWAIMRLDSNISNYVFL